MRSLFFTNPGHHTLFGLVAVSGRDQQDMLGIGRIHYLPNEGWATQHNWLQQTLLSLRSIGSDPLWCYLRGPALKMLRTLWHQMTGLPREDQTFNQIALNVGFYPYTHTEIIEQCTSTPETIAIIGDVGDHTFPSVFTIGVQLCHEICHGQTGCSGRGIDVFLVGSHFKDVGWFHQYFINLENRGYQNLEGPTNVNAITEADVIPMSIQRRGYGPRRVVLVDLTSVPVDQIELEAAKVIYHTQRSVVTILLTYTPLNTVDFNYYPQGF